MKDRNKLSRRNFLKTSGLMGAGAVLPIGRSSAGVVLSGLIPEEDIIPGVSHWIPSTCLECHAGCGVKVRIREGNAVKIEGGGDHPINGGGLCARGQAALQGLYSPARVKSPLKRGSDGKLEAAGWEDVGPALAQKLQSLAGDPSNKIVIVTRQVTGAMRAMLDERAADLAQFEFFAHEPIDYVAHIAANGLCFGIEAVPTYKFDKARTVISFGADLLETWLSPVGNSLGLAESQAPVGNRMGRLIQFESHLSLTGANADDRFAVPPGGETLIALAIASLMLDEEQLPQADAKAWREALEPFSPERAARAGGPSVDTLASIAERLKADGPSLAIAGGPSGRGRNATALQIAVNLINYFAENYGETISFERTENAPSGSHARLMKLVEDMEAGRVGALIVADTNLEFAFPGPERLRAALDKVPLKIQLAAVRDSSGERFDFVLPTHHWLERWDQLEPRGGLFSLQQPAIKPMYDSRHPGQIVADILAAWSQDSREETEQDDGKAPDYEKILGEKWEQIRAREAASDSSRSFWRKVLVEGGCWGSPTNLDAEIDIKLDAGAAKAIAEVGEPEILPGEKILLPIATIRHGDGRQTGRPWLSELPDPITTIAWDAPLIISPATAKEWECGSGDVVELVYQKLPEGDGGDDGDKTIKAPVYVQLGTEDSIVAAPLGKPSEEYLEYAFDAENHPLHNLTGEIDRHSGALVWTSRKVIFKGVVGKARIARMQGSDNQGGREIARAVSLDDIGKNPEKQYAGPDPHKYDLYPVHEHPIHDWTMAVDLSACIGCGACAVACQAENNVPVVGRGECLLGREISWLRIERFVDDGRIVFLPMMCQQCEHAPCETVCPVYASVHSSEGLNIQVYNRCVGTRYCANNCPYKVRRFNWYTYKTEPPLQRQLNPDISIRTRGIMEKCTFCVQRIREHKEIAKDEERPLRDGEITPACAQSCPTRAITFGDLNDPKSRISAMMSDPRSYTIFSELNTQPSIIYLERVYHDDSRPVNIL